jgi:hypothetical protein
LKTLLIAAAIAATPPGAHAPVKIVNTGRLEFEGTFTGLSRVVSTPPLKFEGLYTEFAAVARTVRTGPLVFEGLVVTSAPVPAKNGPVSPKGIHR